MIRALAVLALIAGSAHADTVVELPNTTATLTLPDGWNRATHTYKGIVEIYKHDSGSILVVTRADVPNPDAWVTAKKQAYADQVEKGIKNSVPGYRRVAKKLADVSGIPALDLEAKNRDGATLVVRVLLYRTYAVSLGIEVPKRRDVAKARALRKAFGPPTQPTPAAPGK